MRRKEGSWWLRALVSIGTFALGGALVVLFGWLAGVLGMPPSLAWIVYVVGPIIIVGVYVLVLLTTLGKYLWDFPPSSLG